MTITERLQKYMDFKGLNPNKVTVDAELSVGLIGKAIKNNRGLNSDTIEKILYKYNDLNPEWFVLGKGEMIKTKSEENVTLLEGNEKGNQEGNKPKVKKRLPNEDEAKVYPLYNEQEYNSVMRKIKFADGVNLANNGAPYYPIPVTAGNTEQLLQEEEKPTGFISIPGIYCKAYFPVVGFSFEPLIRAGDVIGIDFIDRWERLDPDSIYFIITENQRMIKRLSDDPENPDRLICISPNFKEFPIWKDEIRVIHKVIFYGRLV